jgi:hypothetical protein
VNKNRSALKILYQQHEGGKNFMTMFKISIVYFQLNKLSAATEFITKAAQLCSSNQTAIFWKGVILYYYIHSKKAFSDTPKLSEKKQEETFKVLQSIIKQAEQALMAVT